MMSEEALVQAVFDAALQDGEHQRRAQAGLVGGRYHVSGYG